MVPGKKISPVKSEPQRVSTAKIKEFVLRHLHYTLGKDVYSATKRDWFVSAVFTVRDYLMEKWLETHRSYHYEDAKRVYYLSMEFLIGKTLANSLINTGMEEELRIVLKDQGLNLDEIFDVESEAGLGNGGLGRLAACFLDSMATIGIPGYGYGIRYEYGMFNQKIKDFQQIEHPDNWLRYGNPWEFPRPEFLYTVKFYGNVREFIDGSGKTRDEWVDCEEVMPMVYDIPVPGYNCKSVNNLRLWSAKSSRDFDLEYFNNGNYIKAVEKKNNAENISKVIYPDDTSLEGKELRLRQEYFLVSATLQDIFRRYKNHHSSFDEFPDKVAIQLNDTHPSLAVAELMRILIDVEGLDWDKAWDITRRTVNYTNHTVLSEPLETWSASFMEKLLPRHMNIIYGINHSFLKDVYHRYPGDIDRIKRMSIIDEAGDKRVRMANLAIIGSSKVNGVAGIHTEILKKDLFRDFHDFYPGKFTNKTNGISQRVWLRKINRELSGLISASIGDKWITDLFELKKLVPYANDAGFREEWRRIKRDNKAALAAVILDMTGVTVSPDSVFDVHVKRVHEYKRQLLNILHVITLYKRLKSSHKGDFVPRTFIYSGKAAPGYKTAKDIIALINSVADIINSDPSIEGRIKIVFLPNYNVSLAEKIIPAADVSEQISTAGTEASGTGCMKLALNGALTVCTLDGANIEMKEEIGDENIFVFGLQAGEVEKLRGNGYSPYSYYQSNPELAGTIDMIANGFFSPWCADRFHGLAKNLRENDKYMVLADYASYVSCQERVSSVYLDRDDWTRKSIINVASMGKFSSDRTIREYAEDIWGLK